MESSHVAQRPEPRNKGKLVGQKAPFKLKEDALEIAEQTEVSWPNVRAPPAWGACRPKTDARPT